jgi:deoxyribodipyrimidine photolyase
MNKEYFSEISQYLLQGKISITTYRMLIETFERMHQLKQEHKHLEQSIIDELIRMEQGEFNHYHYIPV